MNRAEARRLLMSAHAKLRARRRALPPKPPGTCRETSALWKAEAILSSKAFVLEGRPYPRRLLSRGNN